VIAITMDTDWAPEAVVHEAAQYIRSAGCKVTAFCTGTYDVDVDELAIHPNFTELEDLNAPIEKLKALYPDAVGTRSHCLFYTERLRPLYSRHGLTYDSNAIQYQRRRIQPSLLGRDTLSLPVFFMDCFHLELAENRSDCFSTDWIDWDDTGLKIFDFHPVHILLNSHSVAHYEEAKQDYHNPERLARRARDGAGVRSLLHDILEQISIRRLPTYTMREINSNVRNLAEDGGNKNAPWLAAGT